MFPSSPVFIAVSSITQWNLTIYISDSGWIQLNKEEFIILRCRFLKSTAVFVTLLLFSLINISRENHKQ
ncbi:hypothetical protein P8452_66010 [Trifolium repens]|nr:hypothetical protein P8452_66010 [Trifolium repens]